MLRDTIYLEIMKKNVLDPILGHWGLNFTRFEQLQEVRNFKSSNLAKWLAKRSYM
jgi:hypothetical protein